MFGDIMNHVEKYVTWTSKNDGKCTSILYRFFIGNGRQNDVKIDEKIDTNCLRNHVGKVYRKIIVFDAIWDPFGSLLEHLFGVSWHSFSLLEWPEGLWGLLD